MKVEEIALQLLCAEIAAGKEINRQERYTHCLADAIKISHIMIKRDSIIKGDGFMAQILRESLSS